MAANVSSIKFVSASSQKVVVTNPTALNGLSAMTIMFYMKVNTLATSKGVISRMDGSNNNQFSVFFDGADNTKLGMVIASSPTDFFGNFCLTPTGQLSTGAWHKFAVVFDGSQTGNANRLKIYIDNVQVGSLTFNGTIPASLTGINQDMQWGTREANSNYADIKLDQIAIYNVALTTVQMGAYFDADQTGNTGLIEYWKNDNNTGTTTTASTGTNGTLDNANQWDTDVPFATYLAAAASGMLGASEI